MTIPHEHDEHHDPLARHRAAFPAIELPQNPFSGAVAGASSTPVEEPVEATTTAPATSIDGRPVGGADQPQGTWQYPYQQAAAAAPVQPTGYVYQVVPPPAPTPTPAAAPTVPAASPVPVQAAPAAATTMPVMPTLDPVPGSGAAATSAVPPRFVVLAYAALAVLMVVGWKLSFSGAMLGLAAMFVAELAVAHAAASSGPRSGATTALGVLGLAGAAAAGFLSVRELTDEFAFVAGLMAVLVVLPALVVLGITMLVLRRQDASPAVTALRSGTTVALLLLVAGAVGGYMAYHTFSARTDAIVGLAVAAWVALQALSALRGTGRAA
ncbi:MAG: hypothetical protein KDC46_08865 [Thermoleophilia bacterium]|nr:hypothetical protein [Thermoleophilia bacterium]